MKTTAVPDDCETVSPKPIVRCSMTCPMCGLTGNQFRLSPRMFWHNDRDIDLQPRDFQCRRGMEGLHPPLFAMWHCEGCRFTAEYTNFASPMKDVLIRTDAVASRLSEIYRDDAHFRITRDRLSEGINLAVPDFFQAIKLHMLALSMWDLIGEMVKQDYTNQARYSLLLAWLYRDTSHLDRASDQTAAHLATLVPILAEHRPDLPVTEESALHKAIAYYEASLAVGSFVKDPINVASTTIRIARIQIKLDELDNARETLRRSSFATRKAASEIRRRLIVNTGAASIPAGSEREKLVDQERRLLVFIDDEQRLTETIRDKTRERQNVPA